MMVPSDKACEIVLHLGWKTMGMMILSSYSPPLPSHILNSSSSFPLAVGITFPLYGAVINNLALIEWLLPPHPLPLPYPHILPNPDPTSPHPTLYSVQPVS